MPACCNRTCRIFERGTRSYRAFEIKSIADLAHRWHGVPAVYRRFSTTIAKKASSPIPVRDKRANRNCKFIILKIHFPGGTGALSIRSVRTGEKRSASFFHLLSANLQTFSYLPNSQLLPRLSASLRGYSLQPGIVVWKRRERERGRERGANLPGQIFRRSPIIYDRESSIALDIIR